MKHKNRYSGYFRTYTKAIIWIVIFMSIAKTCTFTTAQVLSDIVDEISAFDFVFTNVVYTAIALFCVELTFAFANYLSNKIAEKIKSSVTRNIHMDLAKKIANSTPKTVKANNSVELSEKMREGNNFVEGVYGIFNQVFAILLGLAALVYTFICSPLIGSMFLAFFLVILAIQFTIIKKMLEKRGKASSASDSSKKLLVEILQGFPDVKSLSLLGGLKTHFTTALNNEYQLNVASANIVVRNELWTNIILSVYKLAFLIVSAWLMSKNNITKGNFIALFMYRNYVYSLVNAVLMIVKYKAQISNSQKRMDEIFEYQTVTKEIFGNTKLYPVIGNLSIKNITACYNDKIALNNISLDIPVGKFVAIVGKSGCGKSTLLNVLARQESISSGEITIDGKDMYDLDEWTWHKAIAHVPQFPFMFSMTIKDNLLLANPDASDEMIKQALEDCYAKDFVDEKGGLDAILEPSQLSGGQQQRLALSRLALRGGKILLLDESTSALDSIAQDEIVKTIQRATANNHTIILVSHRAAPLKKADLVVYMSEGKIIDQGTYDELYDRNESFKQLIDLG